VNSFYNYVVHAAQRSDDSASKLDLQLCRAIRGAGPFRSREKTLTAIMARISKTISRVNEFYNHVGQ
jgi:hypothetical protein